MNILHIGTGAKAILPDSGRAVEDTIYQLSHHQAMLGHNVQVIDVGTKKSRGDTKAEFYSFMPMGVLRFSFELLFILPFIARPVDIVHTNSQIPTMVAVVIKRLCGYKYKVFYTAQSPYLVMPSSLANRLKHTLFEGLALRWADRVIVQTKMVGRVIRRRYKVEGDKVLQISVGLDLEGIDKFIGFNPRSNKHSKMVFYPAVITRRKNQMAVIKAIPQVLKVIPDCRFVFSGCVEDRSYFDEMRDYLVKCHIEGVCFTGQVAKAEVYWYYQKASVFTFPTLYETQGIVLLEAMAFGLPAIASNIRVVREVTGLKEGCALLVNPNNSDELAVGIIRVLQNKHFGKRMAQKGFDLIWHQFGWDKITERTIEEYAKRIKG